MEVENKRSMYSLDSFVYIPVGTRHINAHMDVNGLYGFGCYVLGLSNSIANVFWRQKKKW